MFALIKQTYEIYLGFQPNIKIFLSQTKIIQMCRHSVSDAVIVLWESAWSSGVLLLRSPSFLADLCLMIHHKTSSQNNKIVICYEKIQSFYNLVFREDCKTKGHQCVLILKYIYIFPSILVSEFCVEKLDLHCLRPSQKTSPSPVSPISNIVATCRAQTK